MGLGLMYSVGHRQHLRGERSRNAILDDEHHFLGRSVEDGSILRIWIQGTRETRECFHKTTLKVLFLEGIHGM